MNNSSIKWQVEIYELLYAYLFLCLFGASMKKNNYKYKIYIGALLLVLIFAFTPMSNRIHRLLLNNFWNIQHIELTLKLEDFYSVAMDDVYKKEVLGLLVENIQDAIITYKPTKVIEGVTQVTESRIKKVGLIGIGGIPWFEKRQSTEIFYKERVANIVGIDSDNAEIRLLIAENPYKHYEAAFIDLTFVVPLEFLQYSEYRVNKRDVKLVDNFTREIRLDLHNSKGGNQPNTFFDIQFFDVLQESDTRDSGLLVQLIDAEGNSVISRSEAALMHHYIDEEIRQRKALRMEDDFDVYNHQRALFLEAKEVSGQLAVIADEHTRQPYFLANNLPGFTERVLMTETQQALTIDVFRTLKDKDHSSFFESFDEHWRYKDGQLMRVDLVSASYGRWILGMGCPFSVSIIRDAAGDLRRYYPKKRDESLVGENALLSGMFDVEKFYPEYKKADISASGLEAAEIFTQKLQRAKQFLSLDESALNLFSEQYHEYFK